MDETDLIRRRLSRQRLTSSGLASAAEVVAHLGAVQSQEYAEAKWSLAERMRGEPTSADIDAAFDAGEILRTHVLRPTWHFVARDDIRWMLTAVREPVHGVCAAYNKTLDITPRDIDRTKDAIGTLLADGEPRTRKELGVALASAGVDAEGPRLAHTVMAAEIDGLICSGPMRGKQHTYALISDRAPNARDLPKEEALRELARRYFAGHGPASRRDFAAWASLNLTQAGAVIESLADDLDVPADRDGLIEGPERVPRRTRATNEVLLVPMYDEMIMGYRDVRPTMSDAEQPVGHFERPIVVDGETVGTWRRKLAPRSMTLEVTPLRYRLTRERLGAVEAAADRLGRHLGLDSQVVVL